MNEEIIYSLKTSCPLCKKTIRSDEKTATISAVGGEDGMRISMECCTDCGQKFKDSIISTLNEIKR